MKKSLPVILPIFLVVAVLIALFLLVKGPQVIMARMMGGSAVASGQDLSPTKLSDQGQYKVTYQSSLSPIPINQIHNWTLHVETAGGQPVEQAQILVDGGMPQHGHGLPTQPQVSQNLGNGNYLVEGMKFQMPGAWVVSFAINSAGQADQVVFNLVIQ